MKITYINHSGFLIETRDCYYIFDYYKGELPHLDKEKEVIVFCSHFHEDHFNPQIFGILEDMGMTYQAVLANDIRKRNHLSDLKITHPLIQGVTLFFSMLYMFINLLIDLSYTLFDPRIRE